MIDFCHSRLRLSKIPATHETQVQSSHTPTQAWSPVPTWTLKQASQLIQIIQGSSGVSPPLSLVFGSLLFGSRDIPFVYLERRHFVMFSPVFLNILATEDFPGHPDLNIVRNESLSPCLLEMKCHHYLRLNS